MSFSYSTDNLASESGKNNSLCGKPESMIWKGVSLVSLILAGAAVILEIVLFANSRNLKVPDGVEVLNQYDSDLGEPLPSSCRDVSGASGLYTIQPDRKLLPIMVYCDMDTNGGSWTLVASIHENNIYGKCTVGDKWSSEQGDMEKEFHGSGNWENYNEFGKLDSITTQDYKNAAYHSMEAKDVMIWHVPSNTKLNAISEKAFIKYYSTNQFLLKYGSTLRSLFAKNFRMQKAKGGLEPLIAALNASSEFLTQNISGWFNYKYDSYDPKSNIKDGGNDMYDTGNQVYFRTESENFTDPILYDDTYFAFTKSMEYMSLSGYPFVAVSWIGTAKSTEEAAKEVYIKVKSNFGADGKGHTATYGPKKLIYRGMTMEYQSFNVFNATDPSICEVFFYIGSPKWKTAYPSTFEATQWDNNTREATNIVRITGAPRNLIFGYTLLSKGSGVQVTQDEVELVLKKYMNATEPFKYKVPNSNLEVPVEFERGTSGDIIAGLPIDEREFATPGFIQFRPINSFGFPNAFCPGVKTVSKNLDRVCVGGINTYPSHPKQCGDFARWGGVSKTLNKLPTQFERSQKDIESTLLIFTR